MIMNTKKIGNIIISEQEIQEQVKKLANKINEDYQNKQLMIISVLKSSIYFTADLTRFLKIPMELDFLEVNRYPGEKNSGIVRITRDLNLSINNKDVLIIEAIVNTGLTHSYLLKNLKPKNPRSINICTFLNNKEKRLVTVPVKYYGFEIKNYFVVGYGLDYNENYRQLPYIAEFRKQT